LGGLVQPPARSIAFYLPSLDVGGIERSTVNLLPSLKHLGYEPFLVLNRKYGRLLGEVPPYIEIISLEGRTIATFWPLVRLLRRRRPAVLISCFSHNNAVAILSRLAACVETRLIITQHSVLSKQGTDGGWRYAILPMLYRLLTPWADGIVAVSLGVAADMSAHSGIPRERITIIHNPVITADFGALADEAVEHPFFASGTVVFVAVGRLVPSKDFSTLLSAFAHCRQRVDARLIIIGDGPLRGKLEWERKLLRLSEVVDFLGFLPNPLPYIKRADALVSASQHEAFGIVLVEALGVGTRVISTDCPEGPSEILEGGRYGALVPVGDALALAHAMATCAAGDAGSREMRRRRGCDFSVEAAARRYAEAIESVCVGRMT
jgi:glycosyltransferase involved in cell wall biosynthesis